MKNFFDLIVRSCSENASELSLNVFRKGIYYFKMLYLPKTFFYLTFFSYLRRRIQSYKNWCLKNWGKNT